MIEIRNCTAFKTGHKLFANFSLTLREGEHFVIQGSNGSGKTSLLELISNKLNVVEGEVFYSFASSTVWEHRYQQIKTSILYIAAHSLHTLLTGSHEMFYQQRYYSMGGNFPRVRDLFSNEMGLSDLSKFPESFRINELLDLELIRLSNGQLKKVLILQNLLKGIPKYLLLDFPFEGLDRESRQELIVFLDAIVLEFGTQLVIVDHHHQLPKAINKRLILKDFQIAEILNVDQTYEYSYHQIPFEPESISEKSIVVEMKNVSIRYGEKVIIKDLNWQVYKGDRWVLKGRNGSGKTTIFSLIFADHPLAYVEQVFLFGRRRGTGESMWDIKNRIAYLGPEQLHFIDARAFALTARQFLLSNAQTNNEKLNEMITLFAAQHFIDNPLRNLSSGQLQVVLFIQCLMKDKELLLLDEPFQFMDNATRQNAAAYLNSILGPEKTLIMITHYEDELVKWASVKTI